MWQQKHSSQWEGKRRCGIGMVREGGIGMVGAGGV